MVFQWREPSASVVNGRCENRHVELQTPHGFYGAINNSTPSPADLPWVQECLNTLRVRAIAARRGSNTTLSSLFGPASSICTAKGPIHLCVQNLFLRIRTGCN